MVMGNTLLVLSKLINGVTINIMSIFKSKFLLGVMVVAALFVGVATVAPQAEAASCATFTMTLKSGMRNSQVLCLQQMLNEKGYTVALSGAGSMGRETTTFGPATKAAVVKFQAARGLTADGIFGPMSRAALLNLASNPGTLPAGCQPGWLFNPANGQSCSPTNPPVTGTGPVLASLAANNPASGSLVSGQATADLAHIALSGSGTVTSMTFQRTGISTSSTLTSVYLYDGTTRVSDSATVNTNGVITFNGLNIAVNGSKVISVRADIQSGSGPSGQTVGVTLTGLTASGVASVANVAGNIFTITNGSGIIAAVNVGTQTVSSASINAGTSNYIIWSAPVQVNTRAVWLKGAQLRFIGSAPVDSLQNVALYVDGVSVATTGGVNSMGYLVFDLSAAPKSLTTGSHTVDVRADVVKGSARSFNLSLQNAGDLMVTDSQLNVNVAVSSPTSGSFTTNSAGTISVNAGSVTVSLDPSFTTVTNVTGGATNSVIGRFKLKAYGEDVKVSSLQVTPSVATGVAAGSSDLDSLNNVALYFCTALNSCSQIGSSTNWTTGTITFQLGSSLIIPAGVDSWLEVRADLQTSDNYNFTSGTVTVTLEGSASFNNGQGMASLDSTIDVASADVVTTGLTIATGTLAVSANPAFTAQTVNPNTSGQRIASFVLANQSSSEAVRVTNLKVDLDMTTIASTNISNLRTSETSGSGSTPINPATGDGSTDSVNNFSVNFTLAPGQTKVIDIFADLGAASAGDVTVGLTPTALGASSNVNVTPSEATGQLISLSAGVFANAGVVVSATSAPQYVASAVTGAADATQATYNFKATSGAATISELKFRVTTSTGASVSQVKVGNVTAPVVSGVAYLTGLNIAVPNGGAGINVPVTFSYGPTGTNGNTSGAESFVELTYIKNTIGGTTSATIGGQTVLTDNTLLTTHTATAAAAVGSTATLTFASTAKMQPGMVLVLDETADTVVVVQSIASSTTAVVQTLFAGTLATTGNVYFFSIPQNAAYASTVNNCSMTIAVAGTTVAVGSTSGTDCMSIVGSRPTLGVIDSNVQLANANIKVGSVTVTADSHGDIAINALPFTLSSAGATACTACTVTVKNAADNSTITTTNTTLTYTTGASDETIVTFTGGYTVTAGSTVTLDFYITPISTDADDSLTFSLTTPASFLWTDVAGSGTTGAETGALLTTYPTATSTVQNY
jgi:peptidoglycan hydrolase-like protein with peptidoglycan-binding domain